MRGKGRREGREAAIRRYQYWRDIISKEDRENIDKSLEARKDLIKHNMPNMAKKIEKMLRQEYPSIPNEAFDL